jgi:signal transduction histidine kinase
MGHAEDMYKVLVLAGAAACCCLMMAWRGPKSAGWVPRIQQRLPYREAGLFVGLLLLAFCVVSLLTSNSPWPATVVVPTTVWLIFCAPPPARKFAPVAMVVGGIAGVALTASGASSPAVYGGSGQGEWASVVTARYESWRGTLLVESVVFLAVGCWLMWRARPAAAASLRPPRWGLLLPLAVAGVVLLVNQQEGHAAVTTAAALAGAALLIAILFPTVSADLAALAVISLGLFSLVDVVTPPRGITGAFTVSPGTAPQPQGPMYAAIDRPLVMLAAVECGAILALGAWLVPRTIVAHARVLAGREADAELVGRVQQLTETRAVAVDTAATELRRVERDLHDGAQARLVALGMSLRAAERLIPTSPQAAVALVAEARESSSKALTELRDLVRGMYPPVLADRGLADAVQALALDTPVRTETDIDLPGRLELPVESACYFAIAEALTNAVKHSGARMVQIRIRHAGRPAPGVLRIEVTDNGTGGADPAKGSGLAGVERRLATFDGILAVSSPVGGPTIIVMEIPCALSSRRTSSC